MHHQASAAALAAALRRDRALVLPGAYDALSAKLVEEAGFEVVYIGSYAVSAAGHALPDVGALTLEEILRQTRSVAEAVRVPVVADAEGGFFEPGNLWRTIRGFEDAGAAAIHLEDHAGGKHTSLPQKLIPLEAMEARLRAAMDARRSRDMAIIARTDAIWATRDPAEALRRLKAFEALEVDYLFPTGATPKQLREIRGELRTPIVTINLPHTDPEEWDGAAELVIDYGFCLRAVAKTLTTALMAARGRSRVAFSTTILEDEAEFEARLGYAAFTERAARYLPRDG